MSRTGIACAAGLTCLYLVGSGAFPALAEAPYLYLAGRPEAYLGRVVDNGHCVKFVQAATNLPRTVEWRAGAWVRGNRSIAPGTPIATFEANGTYTAATGNHAAIYVSQDANGIWVYDQWRGQPVHKRLIRFEGGRGADKGSKSNNAKLYRVIEIRPDLEVAERD